MIVIYTNVLIRYITQDDDIQSKAAEKLLTEYDDKAKSIFISNIIICELAYILEKSCNCNY